MEERKGGREEGKKEERTAEKREGDESGEGGEELAHCLIPWTILHHKIQQDRPVLWGREVNSYCCYGPVLSTLF